jgi:hypothetical protein
MEILDYFTGEITLDENIRTELIDAFPSLKNDVELNKYEKLPAEYINKILIPELIKITDHQKLQKLKTALQTNSKLKALVSQFAFTSLPANTMPSREDTMDNIKDSIDSTFQDITAASKKLLGMESAEERKEYLIKQIIFRANRTRAAMDKTLLGANDGITHNGGKSIFDGKYYGPHGGIINKSFAWNDVGELDQTASDGSLPEVQEEIGNYDKDSVEQMIARVVEQSVRSESIELTVIDWLTESYESKEQQMKAALEWLYAAEAGWEQNRDYLSFAAKWVKDNAVELGLGTIASLGLGTIALLLTVAWWVKKLWSTLGKIPGMGLIKKLWPVLAKIPKYWPIIGAVGAIVPSAKPDVLMDFKPETEPMHRAIQDRVLDEMWKQDRATQDAKINDIWTRESVTLTWAWVAEADFKSEIRNPSSSISTRYPILRAEYEANVRSVTGSSLAVDQAAYRQSILDPAGGDLVNKWEYDLRVEKTIKAQQKFDKATNRWAQQQAQMKEGRALVGDVKHPTHRVRTAVSSLTGGRIAPPPVEKPAPASISQTDAISRSQALRDRAKLLEVTDIKLADGTTIKMTKLDGKSLTALDGLEAEIADAEGKEQKIKDKIKVAKERLQKEMDFHLLNDANANKTGTIANQERKVNNLTGDIASQQIIIDGVEADSRFKWKSGFDLGKLASDPATKTRYYDAVSEKAKLQAVLWDSTKLNTASGKLEEMRNNLQAITKERNSAVTLQNEASIRRYLWVDASGSPKNPAEGLYKEIETQKSRINSAKLAMETYYTDLSVRYSDRIKFDAAKKQVTIDGALTDIKKWAAKIRGVVTRP